MRISVFGLGYVGAVSCGCLAHDGHDVVGVDVNQEKVGLINAGQSPVVEEKIDGLIETYVKGGRLQASLSGEEAVKSTEVSLISVGTPSRADGGPDMTAIERVCETIGKGIRAKQERHLVVVRSTVIPGTVRSTVIPVLESASGLQVGQEIGVCFNPEFLREGKSVWDYYHPPYTLVGSDQAVDARAVEPLYKKVEGEFRVTSLETAEMVKYICNAFHALKLTFANEIGIIGQSLGVDALEAMRLVCEDRKLNISDAYMVPGFAFGGSCLPKDLRALLRQAEQHRLKLPLLSGVMESNVVQIQRAIDLVCSLGKRRVSVLGLSFKAGTDDLRESPLVAVVEALIGKGYDVKVYDKNVALARLIGANRAYIDREIPHIASLMVDNLDAALAHGKALVIGNGADEFDTISSRIQPDQVVVDFVHVASLRGLPREQYHGIAW